MAARESAPLALLRNSRKTGGPRRSYSAEFLSFMAGKTRPLRFYGTTYRGGTGNGGTVFKISSSGVLTTLYSFCTKGVYPSCPDGDFPGPSLAQATNGSLYGITNSGGINGYGTVFAITLSGQLSTIYSFGPLGVCTAGSSPVGGLVQATNGDFYRMTVADGSLDLGTVFKITPRGTYTMLYSFCSNYPSCTDGERPLAGLVQASNGDFYGTTEAGGANGDGTIFQITPSGTLTTIYNFCSQVGCTDGHYSPGFEQATNGDFYGTTLYGGLDQYGSAFRLSIALSRFVETLPTSGEAGSVVKILGNDLTGATSVTFNGVAATFEVNPAGTAISTTVPTGATAGTVQVVTPAGTLSSNVAFRVTP
jgi:uncharacterized repeat protein (TIGR03803 family)